MKWVKIDPEGAKRQDFHVIPGKKLVEETDSDKTKKLEAVKLAILETEKVFQPRVKGGSDHGEEDEDDSSLDEDGRPYTEAERASNRAERELYREQQCEGMGGPVVEMGGRDRSEVVAFLRALPKCLVFHPSFDERLVTTGNNRNWCPL
jgi:hypothetical protein